VRSSATWSHKREPAKIWNEARLSHSGLAHPRLGTGRFDPLPTFPAATESARPCPLAVIQGSAANRLIRSNLATSLTGMLRVHCPPRPCHCRCPPWDASVRVSALERHGRRAYIDLQALSLPRRRDVGQKATNCAKNLTAGAAGLTLSACVQHTWAPGSTAKLPFEQASGQCKLAALGAPSGGDVSASCNQTFVAAAVGAGLVAGAIGTAVQRNAIYNACMEAQGFVATDSNSAVAASPPAHAPIAVRNKPTAPAAALASAPAAAIPPIARATAAFDGTWTGTLSCPALLPPSVPVAERPAFSTAVTATIVQNQFRLEENLSKVYA
jgi:hypothetical protein